MSIDSPQLLLVDDDAELAGMLREFLELQGFQVAVIHDGASMAAEIERQPPDLVVLDVMLPDISGFELLKRLRADGDVPVIMLTARGAESERILGLLGGADDYLPKPCNPLELAARIRAVLKRVSTPQSDPAAILVVGPLRLDIPRRQLTAHGADVALTAAELRLLEQLMRRPGQVLTRGELTQLALDRPIEAYDRSIDTLISKLRRKLSAVGVDKACLRGVRGHGYVLDDSAFPGV